MARKELASKRESVEKSLKKRQQMVFMSERFQSTWSLDEGIRDREGRKELGRLGGKESVKTVRSSVTVGMLICQL